jgi:hypothetical protein
MRNSESRCSDESREAKEDLRGTPPKGFPISVYAERGTNEGLHILGRWRLGIDVVVTSADDAILDGGLRPRAGSPHGFLGVCIDAAKDRCCGKRGGDLLRRLHHLGINAYGLSHLGGDRFAANLLCLPSGYMFGRADDLSDSQISDLVDGIMPVELLRGRAGLSDVESVAEAAHRQAFGKRDFSTDFCFSVTEKDAGHIVSVHDGERRSEWFLSLQESTVEILYRCSSSNSEPISEWNCELLRLVHMAEPLPGIASTGSVGSSSSTGSPGEEFPTLGR